MSTSIDALRLRGVLGRKNWNAPEPFGPDGWSLTSAGPLGASVIVTVSDQPDGREWVHASIAGHGWMPTYDDLVVLHRAAFDGPAYQVFAPSSEHINIHEYALHLWGRLDGRPALPDFGRYGSI